MPEPRPLEMPDSGSKIETGLIDCDIHHTIREVADLFPYLPRNWREYIEQTQNALSVRHVFVGLIKGGVYGKDSKGLELC